MRLVMAVAGVSTDASRWLRGLEVVATLGVVAGLAGVIRLRVRQWWPEVSGRVRGTLLVSYVLTGVVPALLATVFCLLAALLLAFTAAGALVQASLQARLDEARFLAETARLDLQRTPSGALARETLAHHQGLAAGHVRGASLAVVPVTERRCPAAGVRPVRALPVTLPLAAGPWTHLAAPGALPPWIGCEGAAMVLALTEPHTQQVRLVHRAVSLPETTRPSFAVIVDLPFTDGVREAMRQTTGVGVGLASVLGATEDAATAAPAVATGWPDAGAVEPATSGLMQWTTFVDFRDWQTGRTGSLRVWLAVHLPDMLRQLAAVPSSQYGVSHLGDALLILLAVAGALFFVVQLAAVAVGSRLARQVMDAVDDLFTGTLRLRQRDFRHVIPVRADNELGALATSFNAMTGEITGLIAEVASRERAEQELATARRIQRQLLPVDPLCVPGFEVMAVCEPAREVGGDYYDCFSVGPTAAGMLIADVAGKGVGAALHMAQLKGVLLSLAHLRARPAALLCAVERILAPVLDGRTFITMTYAVADPVSGRLTVARAGHSPLVHVSGGGGARAQVVAPPGIAIGLGPPDGGARFAAHLQETTVAFAPGDRVLLYTDGMSDAMNPAGECFGDHRVVDTLTAHAALAPAPLGARLLEAVDAFTAGTPRHDDLTCLLLAASPRGAAAA